MNIMICGHYDHGKTTLNQAIATVLNKRHGLQCETIRVKEPCADTSITTATLNGKGLRFFDLPGNYDYEDYFADYKGDVDAMIMVCPIGEGPMPGTEQQFKLCLDHGIDNIVVYLSKYDIFQEEFYEDEFMLEVIPQDIQSMMESHGYTGNATMISGSAEKAILYPEDNWGDSIEELITTVMKF